MTPGARVAAAIEVLDRWLAGGERLEPILRAWGRANRFAGSKDRRAIGDMVYDCARRRRSYGFLGGGDGGRRMLIGRAIAGDDDPNETFSGVGHAPAPISAAERASLRSRDDLARAPEAVRLDIPDWLAPMLRASLGDRFDAVLEAAGVRAPVDLRVNRLKATTDGAMSRLATETPPLEATPLAEVEGALRLAPGARIAAASAYREGLVELQDASSQAAVLFADPAPGETVLDYCAGGGGKTLALAALMGGEGRVVAHDIEPRRMKDLPARAARAGAEVTICEGAPDEALLGACDLVFVDAPCSGSGTWRRDPEAKWALTPERLARLNAAQADAIAAATPFVREGGRLLYATCSVLSEENEAVATAFRHSNPGFELLETRNMGPGAQPVAGGDGFFAAKILRR